MFRINEDSAELVGIILGDGNIYTNKGINELTITLHKKEEAYANYIVNLIRKTLFENSKITKRKNQNALDIDLRKKSAIKNLILLGLKPGNKITNNIGIPKWIFTNESFIKSCIRGLIDTDGSVYRLQPQWPNITQISFKNNDQKLLSDVRKGLIKLDYHPSKIFGNRIVLTRKSDVERYFKEIRTNNLRYSPVV